MEGLGQIDFVLAPPLFSKRASVGIFLRLTKFAKSAIASPIRQIQLILKI